MRWPRRGASTPDDGWTSEVSSDLALAGFLFLVFVGFTLLAMGPLVSIDAYFDLRPPPPAWVPVLHVMDRIGQRAACLPVLVLSVLACCHRVRTWRPAWLALTAVLAVNFVVGVLKLSLGRGQPEAANPSFFVGGMAYPSGHTANIVLVYGLAAYLLGHNLRQRRVLRGVMAGLVVVLSATMVLTSLTLNWHWFADLVAGLLIGATVLELAIAADAGLSVPALDRGPVHVLGLLRHRLAQALGGAPPAPAPPAAPRTEERHPSS